MPHRARVRRQQGGDAPPHAVGGVRDGRAQHRGERAAPVGTGAHPRQPRGRRRRRLRQRRTSSPRRRCGSPLADPAVMTGQILWSDDVLHPELGTRGWLRDLTTGWIGWHELVQRRRRLRGPAPAGDLLVRRTRLPRRVRDRRLRVDRGGRRDVPRHRVRARGDARAAEEPAAPRPQPGRSGGRGRPPPRPGSPPLDVGQPDDARWVVLADPEDNAFCVLAHQASWLDDRG